MGSRRLTAWSVQLTGSHQHPYTVQLGVLYTIQINGTPDVEIATNVLPKVLLFSCYDARTPADVSDFASMLTGAGKVHPTNWNLDSAALLVKFFWLHFDNIFTERGSRVI
jgi:hypothetical protein